MTATGVLPPLLAAAIAEAAARWDKDDGTRRLWSRDASLWTGRDEARWLGWLDLPRSARDAAAARAVAKDARSDGLTHALVLGMGGSSLCPEVLARTFAHEPGGLKLHVLDSTDPAQIRATEERVDLAKTLVIVSSKSGSTLEPNILKAYFLERIRSAVGPAAAGRRFVAITDPGSALEQEARRDGFRTVVPGEPSVGGRFSALSAFGLVPAAILGVDLDRLLAQAHARANATGPGSRALDNPGVALGLTMGAAAHVGRDKLTLVVSPRLGPLGLWLEQLVAESLGKNGRGIIPVEGEALGAPDVYRSDRLFVYVRLADAPDVRQDGQVAELERAGQPVVRIPVPGTYAIGAEFYRWEIATAVAGAVTRVNPFDQPDVEASKVATRTLMGAVERTGHLPAEAPIASDGPLELYADPGNAAALGDGPMSERLGRHFARIYAVDYCAVLAYLPMNGAVEAPLQRLRHLIRDRRRVATTLGFGPRFLHSTGQAHKGGANTGVFLQVTCDDPRDLPIPGKPYTFGMVKAAQARGDLAVLEERGRRAVRVHLKGDLAAGLAALEYAVARALG